MPPLPHSSAVMTRPSVLAVLCLLSGSAVAQAHHSFAAQYDANQPVTLQGTITKVEWMNPAHLFLCGRRGRQGKMVELGGGRRRAERALSRGLEADVAEGRRPGDHHRLACEERLEPDQRDCRSSCPTAAACSPARRDRAERARRTARWEDDRCETCECGVRSVRVRRLCVALITTLASRSGTATRLPGFRGCRTAHRTSAAPAPKTADGKPDLSGIWLASRAVFDLAQAVKKGETDSVQRRGQEDLQRAPRHAIEGRPERALPADRACPCARCCARRSRSSRRRR